MVLPEKEHVLPSMESWLINKDPYIMVLRTHISCSYSSVYIVLSSIIIPIFNYKTCVCVCAKSSFSVLNNNFLAKTLCVLLVTFFKVRFRFLGEN